MKWGTDLQFCFNLGQGCRKEIESKRQRDREREREREGEGKKTSSPCAQLQKSNKI